MFTPIEELPEDEQSEVLAALDAPAEWESTWDLGLADLTDSFAPKPRSGSRAVRGRWPVAFPLGHIADPKPWRSESNAVGGHRCPFRQPGFGTFGPRNRTSDPVARTAT